jgi:ribosome-binding factor A
MSRKDKVRAELKREISSILHDKIKDPRLGFLTVIDVELSVDLRYANVYYSVLGPEQDEKINQEILESASGFMRKLIAERLKLRFVPELHFILDKSFEKSFQIQKILDDINKNKENA